MPQNNSRDALKGTDANDSTSLVGQGEVGSMKIEEKIARAYHKDLSWRKVLVRLEPDAHNNMVVRRMFANAYGWPVIKHLCDTHFAYTGAAQMPDDEEDNTERAKAADLPVGKEGEEVEGQTDLPDEPGQEEVEEKRTRSLSLGRQDEKEDDLPDHIQKLELKIKPPRRTNSEMHEATDEVNDLVSPTTAANATAASSYSSSMRTNTSRLSRQDSARWSDRFFEGSEEDSDDEEYLASTTKDKRKTDELKAKLPAINTSDQPQVADVLTQSPKESTVDLPLRTEPRQLQGVRTEAEEGVPDPSILGLTGIGLSPSKRMEGPSIAERRKNKPNLGVAEQVAFAKSKKSSVGGGDGQN